MARRKQPAIPDALLDQLLDGADPRTAFNPDGVLDALKKALAERMLNAEMDQHLGTESADGRPNTRNGYGQKTVLTDTGRLALDIPRDRQGSFDPQLIAKYQRRFPGFDEKIVSMYARGMSVREIQGHVREIYGLDVSPDLVSAVTDAVLEEVAVWQNRPLEAIYPLVFFDALRGVRDEGLVRNKAIHVALGVRADGTKEVLGLWIEQNEGAKFWLRVMNELKNRGTEDVLLAVVDGLKGFPEAIRAVFYRAVDDTLADLAADHVRAFLTHLETERDNHIRSRNQRLAMIHTFFAFAVGQEPTLLQEAERVAAIPRKRTPPPATRYLERDEVEELFAKLSNDGSLALRDRALLLFLYNTGARATEAVGLTVGQLTLTPPPQVRLHGKGDKWRICPLWPETARLIADMLKSRRLPATATSPAFVSNVGCSLTRFGLYKLVRRHTTQLPVAENQRAVSPHVFRHTTAVHLLEAGVEINVIRGWLGHVSLDTTNRYAEINIKMKQEALDVCQAPSCSSVGPPRKPIWQSEPKLLDWLAAL